MECQTVIFALMVVSSISKRFNNLVQVFGTQKIQKIISNGLPFFGKYIEIGDDPMAEIGLITVFNLVNIFNSWDINLCDRIKKKKDKKRNRALCILKYYSSPYFFPLLLSGGFKEALPLLFLKWVEGRNRCKMLSLFFQTFAHLRDLEKCILQIEMVKMGLGFVWHH